LELQNLAAYVHRDLARKVAVGHSRGDFGNIADLSGEVAGHEVHAVGEILPHAAHALYLSLATELSFRSDFARHAGHLAREGIELAHHAVDGVLKLQNLAAHVDGDLARKVALGNGGGDLGDVADLRGQIAAHGVHGVGKILPDASHALHLRLTSEFS